MAHTYEALRHMTVAQLREIAEGVEDESLAGAKALSKGKLLPVLCAALGIEAHDHHEVVGIDKAALKARIRLLKVERDGASEAGDGAKSKAARLEIRRLKRTLRRATV